MENIKKRMSEEDVRFYKDIFAPKEVAVPHSDAGYNFTVLKDGRIRHYGAYPPVHGPINEYIESSDGGLSWKEHFHKEGNLGPSTYIPSKGKYVRQSLYVPSQNSFVNIDTYDGCLCYLEAESPDSKPDKVVPIDMTGYEWLFGRDVRLLENRNRICFVGQAGPKDNPRCYYPFFIYSDDGGETWKTSRLEQAPMFEMSGRHKGMRWQNYSCEPDFVELEDGTLYLLARTSQDYFYEYYSYDGGETWTEPKPSIFHGVLTMPELLKLKDGRILAFWTNTMPLAETDHLKNRLQGMKILKTAFGRMFSPIVML